MMVCALAGNSCCSISAASASRLLFGDYYNKLCGHKKMRQNVSYSFKVRASSEDSDDCNTEECAPDKEVGKVSMEWVAGEKTRVVGTYPPRTRGWTGYVEKDTAGQTNIYSVEPAVYIAESAISSGTAGSSADGSENTVAIVAGIALISVAAAALILLQVGKNNNAPPVVQSTEYSGPSLSYYINKFKLPSEVVVDQSPAPEVVADQSPAPEEEAVVDQSLATPPPPPVAVTTAESSTAPSITEASSQEVADQSLKGDVVVGVSGDS